ncbi:hypothetical protein BDZ85DRAFT_206523 [Elsinoe ampelina]|uniref:Arginase-like protein n=2 Tax=Elsinoe TaxID=40996 RepID=A0A8K0KYD7_9PEZI|nr:hypothetical protein BDZ85DRAFT_206523 [Elsinoe ampelina]KAG8625672.1 hypothetical protein KVT40_006073 [Elsinoe batatas]
MARSVSRSTRYYTTQTVQYIWPTQQLLGWRFVMYATGGTIIGVFAAFLIAQQQLQLGIPWIFPYGITVGALTIIFLFVMEAMITQRKLLPGLVMLGGFILLVLYLAGLIETALQLFGSGSNVNGNCQTFVINQPSRGVTLATFAFLQQRSICQSWQAVFAFWIVGVVFLIWLIFLASQVNNKQYE